MAQSGGIVMAADGAFVLGRVWHVTPMGLEVRDGAQPEYAQWRECGTVLTRFYSTAKWAIGDWLLFGDHHYESWTQAAEELGFDATTIRNYVRVAERFPMALRNRALSWHHHLRVAALETTLAQGWLTRAEQESWSCAELSAAMRHTSEGPLLSESLLLALDRAVAGLNRVVQAYPDQTFVAEHVTPHLMGLAGAADQLRAAGGRADG